MIKKYEIQTIKTYKTEATAEKAVAKMLSNNPWIEAQKDLIVYSIVWNAEGRCYPLFIGANSITAGIFHLGFNCVSF